MDAKENFIKAITFSNPEYVPYYGEDVVKVFYYDGAWPPNHGKCIWGVTWDSRDPRVLPISVAHPIVQLEDIYKYQFPAINDFSFNKLKSDIEKINRNYHFIAGGHPFVLFERAWTLTGMDNLLIWMITNEDEIRYLFRKISDFQIAVAQQYLALGVDIGWLSGDDYGGKESMLFSPQLFRKYIKPELARIVNVYKNAGKLVFFHSCGHIMEIVEDLIEIGIDILNPVQATANNLSILKKIADSKLALWGGVDADLIMRGTPDDVRREVIRCIKLLAPGGGYIVSPDQELPFPKENIEIFIETAKEYGKYPIL